MRADGVSVNMFPACAGMNRDEERRAAQTQDVPRVRGDEPEKKNEHDRDHDMFPACAGMNRRDPHVSQAPPHVPRVRGDEPKMKTGIEQAKACSPRARG